MKIKVTNNKLMKVKTRVQSIEESHFTSKSGADTAIVLVHTDAGTFSNFKSEWEKQGIDAEALDEGDMLEVTYKVFEKPHSDRKFMNFIKIERLEK